MTETVSLKLFHNGHELGPLRWIGNGQYVAKINGRDQRISLEVIGQAQDAISEQTWGFIEEETRLLQRGEIFVPAWCERVYRHLLRRYVLHYLFSHGALDPTLSMTISQSPEVSKAIGERFLLTVWADKKYIEETARLIAEGELPIEGQALKDRMFPLLVECDYVSQWHEVADAIEAEKISVKH